MRVLLVQRSLAPPGGGNAVAAWMLHALAGHHQVDTLTLSLWSPAQTNAFYGTSIPERPIVRHVVPPPWRWLSRLSSDRAYRLRMAALLRRARQLSADYDLLVTADDYAVFEKPGIQYVHFPATLNSRPTRLAAIVGVYFHFCDWWRGLPWPLAARNLTLANSEWTAARLRGVGETRVLYPPVVDTGPGEPWACRSNTFLSVGRFHSSKRLEVVMSIVRRLRAGAMADARLVIVGSPVDVEYSHRIREAAIRAGDWIQIREDLSRGELNALMGRSRYGVQAMEGEHFGMATAEMARAGCLVFPHRSGGSVEVVNGAPELLWDSEDEAVARISATVQAPALRDQLLASLGVQAQQFSAERFVERFRVIVSEWEARQVN